MLADCGQMLKCIKKRDLANVMKFGTNAQGSEKNFFPTSKGNEKHHKEVLIGAEN